MDKRSAMAIYAAMSGFTQGLAGRGADYKEFKDKSEALLEKLLQDKSLKMKSGAKYTPGMTTVQVRELFEADPTGGSSVLTTPLPEDQAVYYRNKYRLPPDMPVTLALINTIGKEQSAANRVLVEEMKNAMKTEQGRQAAVARISSWPPATINEFMNDPVMSPIIQDVYKTGGFQLEQNKDGFWQKVKAAVGKPSSTFSASQYNGMDDKIANMTDKTPQERLKLMIDLELVDANDAALHQKILKKLPPQKQPTPAPGQQGSTLPTGMEPMPSGVQQAQTPAAQPMQTAQIPGSRVGTVESPATEVQNPFAGLSPKEQILSWGHIKNASRNSIKTTGSRDT